jgi:deazaflavin-dependent oxidoreductase (nitroreductase family)
VKDGHARIRTPVDPPRPSAYARVVNRFSATRPGSWLVKHVASKIDPVIFRLSGGRFTSTGRPTLPMLALTVPGRHSGTPRTVQLAYHPDGPDLLVVASAMGQERHPAWRYNLEAAGGGDVLVRGERYVAVAERVPAVDKARLWPAICVTIPQMRVYEARTDRDIAVFRLRRGPAPDITDPA